MIKVNRWSEDFGQINHIFQTDGNKEEALERLNRILGIESNPTIKSVAFLYKGIATCLLGRYQETVESADEALKISPEFAPLLYQLKADALRHLCKYREAIELYDEVLKIEPKDIDALMNKGFCLNKLGKDQEAINIADKILEVEPCNIKAIDGKAFSLYCLEKLGGDVNNNDNIIVKIVKFKNPNANVWVLGEQKRDRTWDVYTLESQSKCLVAKEVTTEMFELSLNKLQTSWQKGDGTRT